MAPDDGAMLAEVAEILGVTKRTAQRYIARPDFPAPAERYSGGRVWHRADVLEWAQANLTATPSGPALPRSGRPRKPPAA